MVRNGGQHALLAAGNRVGHAVVQERFEEAIDAPAGGGADVDVKATAVTDAKQVSSVVEKFRHKYGPGDVKKYYSKFDVAVIAPLS